MKKLVILHIIFGLMYATGVIWSVVSFILYLVKDTPFTWLPVGILIVGIVGALINMYTSFNKI